MQSFSFNPLMTSEEMIFFNILVVFFFFFANLAFRLPWQPIKFSGLEQSIKFSGLEKIHMSGRGLLKEYFC